MIGGVTLVAHTWLVMLHEQECREQRVDPLGPLRVTIGVLSRSRSFTATMPRHELLGQTFHRVSIVAGMVRGHWPFPSPGSKSSITGPEGRGCRPGFAAAASRRECGDCSLRS